MKPSRILTQAKYLGAIVFFLAFLFIYAAASKLMEYDVFVAQIGKSPMITDYANNLAWFVPVSEVVISILLFIPATRLIGLYASFSIMYAFSAYIAIMLLFSPYVPCSCGGILSHMEWSEHLIFNIAVTFLCVIGVVLQIKHLNKSEIVERYPSLN